MRIITMLVSVAILGIAPMPAETQEVGKTGFTVAKRTGSLEIFVDGLPFATYVWNDPATTRPYFKQVAIRGTQLTRNHPPHEGDFDDHATFHPGIWWGFGDVGGNDYWRMKAPIIGGAFVKGPTTTEDSVTFTVRNQLRTETDGSLFGSQICRYQIVRRPTGILMICETELRRDQSDFWLGDQEEMGLAFRVATPLTVERGGQFRDSHGNTQRKQLRRNQGDWCDYSGPIAGKHGGMLLMNDPQNFRKPWWHAVETGLLVANPLGESELSNRGKKRQNVLVQQGKPFHLRYGILLHLDDHPRAFDAQSAYEDFVALLAE